MKTILVVDDEYLIAQILGWALEDAGFDVELAGNGHKALELLKGKRVELVITDYMMPGMNGEELATSIRAEPQWQGVSVMLMSGAQAYRGREAPALFAAVFDKPFDIDQLIAKVKELVGTPEAP
ncbi:MULTISPECIES: response regulator [Pseudomonas]|uniref:Response regulator n=2 Tax=Pseudomonas TaxID=286 RepID=A0A411MJZ6_9PSED|nr:MULTISPECIES: response regulator [Pseudomonas]MDD1016799.1 response regulator [Pseudomonas rubra]MDD1038668.1 response regulator [Pseudomonas rubra]MDD1157175.1 response regulator [Pseudomonas rubra]QBF27123.1 response regulator [Pseudomonas tructae]